MDRFVRGEITIVCYNRDEVNTLLDTLIAKYPDVRWKDTGEISGWCPSPPDPIMGLTFICERNKLSISRYGHYDNSVRLDEVLEATDCQACDGDALMSLLLT